MLFVSQICDLPIEVSACRFILWMQTSTKGYTCLFCRVLFHRSRVNDNISLVVGTFYTHHVVQYERKLLSLEARKQRHKPGRRRAGAFAWYYSLRDSSYLLNIICNVWLCSVSKLRLYSCGYANVLQLMHIDHRSVHSVSFFLKIQQHLNSIHYVAVQFYN